MLLIALRKGGAKCSSACPFYAEKGQINGVNDTPLKTHCRATMQSVIIDCDSWNPKLMERLEVTEDEWRTIQQMLGRNAIREHKPLPDDHNPIHPVGWSWRHDRWNKDKSAHAKIIKH